MMTEPVRPAPKAEARPRGTQLSDVVRETPGARITRGAGDPLVSGVKHDSREVSAGDLFVARSGASFDGLAFVEGAIQRGAVAVLAKAGAIATPLSVPLVEAEDPARAMAFAAASAYGHPTFGLDVCGITGTNGKTTTAQLVAAVLEASGARPGVLGTLGQRFEGFFKASKHTSPESDELARFALEIKDRGATHLVMEVSSIALAASRVEAVRFRVAAFTNLTQDHLDFHGTMEAYAEAKARLFVDLGPSSAAINVDDPFGAVLATRLVPGLRVARFSARSGALTEVGVESLGYSARGISMSVRSPVGTLQIESPLVGAHNVENLLTAIAIAALLDVDPSSIETGLNRPTSVPGRLERCDDPDLDDLVVLVDYAHTPDALSRALASVRAFTAGGVVCVFGCGGDRDPAKRPMMGKAALDGADHSIVTNDNPRSEDPEAIARDIVAGMAGGEPRYEVELDRQAAITRAIESAAAGDVVLVAGKGHETYQIIGRVTHDFDDRDVARHALAARREGRGP